MDQGLAKILNMARELVDRCGQSDTPSQVYIMASELADEIERQYHAEATASTMFDRPHVQADEARDEHRV